MVRMFVILPTLILGILLLSGCGHTFHGAGEDLEEWGKTLQETF